MAVEAMLAAALRAFATYSYDGVSVNAPSRQLGLSHNLLHQRFGSKDALWHAAVDWGFGGTAHEVAMAVDPTVTDPLDQLAAILRRFLHASAERPELVGLMNLEGRESTERLTYLYENCVKPILTPIARVLDHLAAEGRVRPVSGRTLLFLVAHGAAAPFTLRALAREVDPAKGDLERDVSAARASSQAQAEKLRETAETSKGKISDDWADVQKRWNEHIVTVRGNIESKKAGLDAAKAERHAEHGERDAYFAIYYAYAAIDEAESAVVNAVLARMEADELAAGAGTGA